MSAHLGNQGRGRCCNSEMVPGDEVQMLAGCPKVAGGSSVWKTVSAGRRAFGVRP